MLEYEWTLAFLGGLLVGAAALILLLFNGRIAGVSGIAFGLAAKQVSDKLWRVLFLLGLAIGGLLATFLGFDFHIDSLDMTWWQLALAGLFVGMGARLANGCTSGHGVCGIGRGSLRSLVATVVFMASAMLTVYLF